MTGRAGAALAVAALSLAAPSLALAHPQASSSLPRPNALLAGPGPTHVSVTLSEASEPVGNGISVVGPSGTEVSVGSVTRRGQTLRRAIETSERGTYLVRWQVTAADTHVARGAFLFNVGERTSTGLPGDTPAGVALQAVGRWLSLTGSALGLGLPAVALIALGGVMGTTRWRLVGLGIGLMLVAEPVALLGQTTVLAPDRPFEIDLAGDVLRTSYGHVAGLRVGVALALWALVAVARETGRKGLVAITTLGAIAAFVQAGSLHRIEELPVALSLVVGAAHIAAALLWIACIGLAAFGESFRALAPTASSALLVAVMVGPGLGLAQLQSFADLIDTGYGRALLAKLATVGLAVALGMLAGRRDGLRRVELTLAAAVLALGALLASLVPPGS